MNPEKVVRDRVKKLTDLPNVGAATAGDLRQLGIQTPADLLGKDPLAMYQTLCVLSGVRQDPCVLDVFISLTRFAAGEPARVWWAYTEERKQLYGVL